jgi:oligoendopeptidase F
MDLENPAKGTSWSMAEISFPLRNGKWKKTLAEAENMALMLRDSSKNIFLDDDPFPDLILGAIKKYEYINEMCRAPYLNAFLYKASDVMDHERAVLFQKIKEKTEQIYDLLMPLELQFSCLSDRILNKLGNSLELKEYRYVFARLIEYKPYLLSEPEEKLIKARKLSNRLGLVSDFDRLMSSLLFHKKIKGSFIRINISRALNLLCSSDRATRTDVFKGFMEALAKIGSSCLSILNSLVYENNNESGLRGYATALRMSSMRNDISFSLLTNMMDAVAQNYPLVSKYYEIKSCLLGIDDFKIFDISAPMIDQSSILNFSEARELILEALDAFHPAFAAAALDIFEKRLIDAEMREDKQNGAFCKCLAPSQKPYISLKYTGSMRSVLELAHEIGHGIQYLLSAEKSYLNFTPVPVMSETASTFVETLISNHILKSDQLREIRHEVVASVIESKILTVFRQNMITIFEKTVHEMRRTGVLNEEDICQVWFDENRRLYGDAVELAPEYRWGWIYIPHIIHHHYYCYSYIFGSLVSLLLFTMYEKENKFAGDIVDLFASGATQSPISIIKRTGLNINERTSWDFFFEYVEELINFIS